MTTESDLQSAAYERLSWEPRLIPFRLNCGKLHSLEGLYYAITYSRFKLHAGVSDLAVLVDGVRMEWIELKTARGALRDSQIEFRDLIVAAGGRVHLAKSMDDIERIIEILLKND